jgi:hypothetical protein
LLAQQETGGEMITICTCRQDSAGNHEWDFPLNPNYSSTHATYISYCTACIEKDKWILELNSQLTSARKEIAELYAMIFLKDERDRYRAALMAIRDHEHLKCLKSSCEGIDPTKVSDWIYEIQMTNLILGKIYGHRCCAKIADEALKGGEE